MLTPGNYTDIHGIDLHDYYSESDRRPLTCELCPPHRKNGSVLKRYELYDGRTRWYFCPGCGFAGTGLDYIAALGKESPVRTVRTLQQQGHLRGIGPETIRAYGEYLERNKRFRTRYRECRPFNRTGSATLTGLENLDDYFHVRRYRTGDRKTFERLFHPGTVRHGASGSRLFHGRQWGRITAIPLYDFPLRMSSLLFVNGLETGQRSISIKRLGPGQSGVHSFEPGYLATSEILSRTRPTDSIVFSVDWLRVLRFQADIWHQEREVAPIVGWFPDDPRTGRAWSYRWTFFRDIPKVFWSAHSDMASLREACIRNAQVSYAYYHPESGVCLLPAKLMPGAIVRSVAKNAVPWHQALLWHLGNDPETAESRLSTLQLPQRTLETFLQHAPDSMRKFVAARFHSATSTSRYIDGNLIVENDDGWHRASGNPHIPPTLLSSARCIVDRVLCFADKEPMYQGRVLLHNESHPFVENESVIEKNAVRFVRQVCVENRSEHLPIINVHSDKLMKLIRAHGNFRVVPIKSGFGWDDETASLLLPNLTLSDRAVVAPELPLDYGPFSSLRPKHAEPLTPSDLQVLVSFREETPYVLAMFVSMLPVLFAPAYRMEAPQTTVVSPNVELLEQLFGMLRLPASMKSVTQSITDYAGTHRCPYLVRFGMSRSHVNSAYRATWSDQIGLHGCGYVAGSIRSVLARMSYGRANMLLMPKIRFYRWLQGRLPDVYLKCFTGLLRHVSRYVLEPKINSENWNSDLILEGIRFLESEQGLPVHKGTLYEGYYDSSAYFCDYVTILQKKEELTVGKSADAWSIPVTALGDCYRNHVGMFDFQRVKDMLGATMLLKEYDPTKHVFLVDPEPFQASPKRVEIVYGQ